MYEELVSLFHYIWFSLNEISSVIQAKAGGVGTNTLQPQTQNHHHTSGLPTYMQLILISHIHLNH
jgi:hypothetical protein